MTVSKLNADVAVPVVSYLGPSAADYARSLDGDDEDIFVDDEREPVGPMQSLFPLAPPRYVQDCCNASKASPPKFDGDFDCIEAFRLAEIHFDRQHYGRAMECLNEIIRSMPHHTAALLLRAECYHAQQQHAQAVADYSRVLEWGGPSECDDARLLVADCLLALDEDQQAFTHADRAVEATKSSDSYALRGRALAKAGDLVGARRDLEMAQVIASTNTHLIVALREQLNTLN